MTGAGLEETTLGPFQLLRRLGGGALGEVYLARHAAPDGAPAGEAASDATKAQQFAIKVLRPAATDPMAQQLLAECERVTALRQRHIIPLHGAASDGSTLGIVMAYAPGGSLADLLARDDEKRIVLPLAFGVVARLTTQLGHGLAAAHAAGIVHGDLKPSNIFVRSSSRGAPFAAISDFGQSDMTRLAAQLATNNELAAQDDWIRSQLLFAAPEQAHGALSPATDQYALAAVVYYLLTGRPPFMGAADALLTQLATAEPAPVTQFNPDAPASLDDVVAQALAKQPEQRYPSVEAFVRALDGSLAEARANTVSGVTTEFAQLGGGRRGPGARKGSRLRARRSPDDTGANLWRPLATATIAALLIAMLTCAISAFAIGNASRANHSKPTGFEGPNAAPTVTEGIDQSQTPQGQLAQTQLQATLAQTPLFSDTLASNAAQWPIVSGQVYFGSDSQLHLVNTITTNPITADAPTAAPKGDYAEQVTMTITSGVGGDLAGMRFFVNGVGDARTYYAFFVSPDGQFYLWYYNNSWSFISGGFASHMRRGDGATNTITVIAQGTTRQALLFVNGAYVGAATLIQGGPVSGGAGVIVLNHGVEATYTNFALYPAHS